MSLFEELGLKPGDGNITALKKELELRRNTWSRPGYVYRGAGDFILQHGEFWNGVPLPEEWAHLRGEESACFANALAAAESNPELRYVEGMYAVGAGHYTPHAWCLAPDGTLLELTLPTYDTHRYHDRRGLTFLPPESWAYGGVVFPELKFVQWHNDHYGLPMFNRPAQDAEAAGDVLDLEESHDFPVFKLPFDPNRKEM
jgi:hypothetical protein